ncbi:MAG: non-ribosomal peptide synthetase, partial [Mycobacteriales bacterium]
VLDPLDLSGLDQSRRDAELRRVMSTEISQPFDLAHGPLLRVHLVRLGRQDHALFIVMHHIITDGWSMGVLVGDLRALYRAAASHQVADLAPLPVQYADFAAWQRATLPGSIFDEGLAYWRRQLDGVTPLALPTDRPRPAVRTAAGATHEFVVPAGIITRLEAAGRQRDGTLFMTLVAACQLLLSRWSGQDDIAVGTVVSGRERAGLEGMIGFFVNTLVLRSRLDHSDSFTRFLRRVRDTVLEAFSYQDVPFERLVDECAPVRDTSRTPLFQALVILQNTTDLAPELPGLEVEELALPATTASFDITLEFGKQNDILFGVVQYNTDLFDAATIERMVGHLLVLLGGIAADPDQPITKLPMLSHAEQHQLLVEWNDTQLVVPAATLPELFAAQVTRTPDAVAVVVEGAELTYGELNERANRLARVLIARGVGPERFVGLALPRSMELIVALQAVTKTGAAYLPIDPNHPAARVGFICADADPVVVVCTQRTAECLPRDIARLVIDEPHTIQEIAGCSGDEVRDDERAAPLFASNPAYAIYTSGSTGQPKAVVVTQRSVVDLAGWAAVEF